MIDQTTAMLFGAMRADQEGHTSLGVETPTPSEESHRVIWVASEPERSNSRIDADDAIRDRERRTREKWAREREEQTRVDVHHHLHQEPPGPAHQAPDDVIDAEVVEDFDQPGAAGTGRSQALPPGPSTADPFARARRNEEDRRDR